jgi:hypothetical protein
MTSTSDAVGAAFGYASGIGVAVIGSALGGYASDCRKALRSSSPLPSSTLPGAPAGFSRETCETLASLSNDTVFILTWVIALAIFGVTTVFIVIKARATEPGATRIVPPPASE